MQFCLQVIVWLWECCWIQTFSYPDICGFYVSKDQFMKLMRISQTSCTFTINVHPHIQLFVSWRNTLIIAMESLTQQLLLINLGWLWLAGRLVVSQLESCRFDFQFFLAIGPSVLGQDTEPQPAPDGWIEHLAWQLPLLVCECVCEWVNVVTVERALGCMEKW